MNNNTCRRFAASMAFVFSLITCTVIVLADNTIANASDNNIFVLVGNNPEGDSESKLVAKAFSPAGCHANTQYAHISKNRTDISVHGNAECAYNVVTLTAQTVLYEDGWFGDTLRMTGKKITAIDSRKTKDSTPHWTCPAGHRGTYYGVTNGYSLENGRFYYGETYGVHSQELVC